MSTENNSQSLYESTIKILSDLIAFKTISGEDNNQLINYCDEILKKFGLPILNGKSYEKNLDLLETELKDLKGPPWVVKSQIHAGGRGAGYFKNSFNDKGGVQVIFEKDQVNKIAYLEVITKKITLFLSLKKIIHGQKIRYF